MKKRPVSKVPRAIDTATVSKTASVGKSREEIEDAITANRAAALGSGMPMVPGYELVKAIMIPDRQAVNRLTLIPY